MGYIGNRYWIRRVACGWWWLCVCLAFGGSHADRLLSWVQLQWQSRMPDDGRRWERLRGEWTYCITARFCCEPYYQCATKMASASGGESTPFDFHHQDCRQGSELARLQITFKGPTWWSLACVGFFGYSLKLHPRTSARCWLAEVLVFHWNYIHAPPLDEAKRFGHVPRTIKR